MNNINILKVQLDAKTDTPTIHYERFTPEGITEDVKHPGDSAAHPDLSKAMDKLARLVIDVCRLSEDWNYADTKVIGVSIKDKDDGYGLNVTLLGKFTEDNGTVTPVVINSPYIPPVGAGDDVDIERIQAECIRYIEGKRQQASLFDQDAA